MNKQHYSSDIIPKKEEKIWSVCRRLQMGKYEWRLYKIKNREMKIQELPQVPHYLPSIHDKSSPYNHIKALSPFQSREIQRHAQCQKNFSNFPYIQGVCYQQPAQEQEVYYEASQATYATLPSQNQQQDSASNTISLSSEESLQIQPAELGQDECILVQCITDDGVYSREMWDHCGLSKIAM